MFSFFFLREIMFQPIPPLNKRHNFVVSFLKKSKYIDNVTEGAVTINVHLKYRDG